MRARVVLLSALAVLALVGTWSCALPAPQVVEKVVTVEVEKPVVQTVVATVEVVKELAKERPKLTIWFADDMAPEGTECRRRWPTSSALKTTSTLKSTTTL